MVALIEGAGTVVFNGDTVERRDGAMRAEADRCLEALTRLCRACGAEPVFINGNHDPDLSSLDHVALCGGAVLVTHGHALFPEIAPWGRESARFRENYARALERLDPDGEKRLSVRLAAATEACKTTRCHEISRSGAGWLASLIAEFAHPVRPLEMVRAWVETPGRAVDFADRYCPQVGCVVLGHTHFPGSWMRGERCVMNTGAYLPWLGRRLVEVTEERVVLRKVERVAGDFRPGRELSAWLPESGRGRLASGEWVRSEGAPDF